MTPKEQQLRLLAALNLVVALLSLVGGVQLLARRGPGGLFGTVGWLLLLLAIPAALAGVGLLRGRAWGRTSAFVSAVVSAPIFPIGTAFAIYSFLMLRDPEVMELLR